MNLIERLRAEHVRNGGQGAYAWKSRELCGKAATEIERLTAQVEVLRLAGNKLLRELEWVNEQLDLMPDDYAKSIVRFTAALSYRGGDCDGL